MKIIDSPKYRKDIDGLRSIAIIPVIVFHFGHLPNGYLGVDIFFVISGFLITGIIFRQIQNTQFSILDFYIRRTRRIIPLVSFICLLSLLLGIIFMLPDDLENLTQSIIATNFFGNNILQILTTKNYWDIVNEFKPLMHTWSLAIEEQYYLIYPFIFLLLGKKRKRWILPVIMLLSFISLALYFSNFPEYEKFYLLQFRFFELSIGGIAAITLNGKLLSHRFRIIPILLLIALIFIDISFLSNSIKIILCTLFTALILISDNESQLILKNNIAVFIGKISFSLYMWHQVILAFSKYTYLKETTVFNLFLLSISIIALSYLSYKLIEQPFRNKDKMKLKTVIITLTIAIFISSGVSFYIYQSAGVLKDIPQLGIERKNAERNMHAKYNDRIYKYDQDFPLNNKINVLIIGNSFARDWANVLLENSYSNLISISYIYDHQRHQSLKDRLRKADKIFIHTSSFNLAKYDSLITNKIWFIGTKNFGINNGVFYNYIGTEYCMQRTVLEKGILKSNTQLKKKWGERYINLIEPIIDDKKTVPVFTPDCKFISQDCRHYTQFGALYMSNLLDRKIESILFD